ncbi:GRIP and coiled-coil domain-containing protein 2 [Amyelois transitella]|uniref:GRIP and coiled-coil domain-containing protein 2 n=1 Tax=Amyelois transitella TaxID=680683 RepID=UPI0029904EFB|nr:GRIP and coiled-coil domain-containing protein 2 [Amyelois transitella]
MDKQGEGTSPENVKKSPFDDLTKEELVQKYKGLLAIAQKAKQARSDLLAENETYKKQFQKYETEKKSYLENIQTLQELVNSLTEQKLNYITEVDAAHTKIKALNNKCNSYEEEIDRYKAEIIVKDQKYGDTAQKLSDLDSEIISLKRQNKRLLEENEQLINQLTDLETQINEFNNIGLQQREQLKILEEKVHLENEYKVQLEHLNNKIRELQTQLISNKTEEAEDQVSFDYEKKIKDIMEMFEAEKNKKEKANIKLRSYKDKILKCAACINQLKNSRFILAKTVKEYSENIPKWQNDILKASKVLDDQIDKLNKENSNLKEKLNNLENIYAKENGEKDKNLIAEINQHNELLKSNISDLQNQLKDSLECNNVLKENLEKIKVEYQREIAILSDQIIEVRENWNEILRKNKDLNSFVEKLQLENKKLLNSMEEQRNENEEVKNMALQIKALESEKSMLVKEKMNARDSVVELENQNKSLTVQLEGTSSELQLMKSKVELLSQQKSALEAEYKNDKNDEVNHFKSEMKILQEQYDLLKKEHDHLQDLNGLLKEEVETLKLSLEQPKDDTDNSDLNVSLQADIVKLETKLSAYKQENATLLSELKESRSKIKEFDNLVAEYEDAKSKLMSYKTENSELLNEMKEINQVLKERGESISKLQKAIAELERLVETLEKARDDMAHEKDNLNKKIENLENELKNAESKTDTNGNVIEKVITERDNALKLLSEKEAIIVVLKDEIDKFKQAQISADLPQEDMSTSTISRAEELSRMRDLDETFEEKYTKLRIFALKLKKKLNETKTELQNVEQDKAKIEKLLHENVSKQVQSGDEVDGIKQDDKAIQKDEIDDLQARVTSLTEVAETGEKTAAELLKVRVELETMSKQLAAEIGAHKVTKEQLEKARRDAKKKNVLSLEMEDYERSMKELTTKMEEKKKKMVQMESTIDTQEGTITAMKTQIKLLEEQIKTEETQNRLIREELQHVIEEGKEKDSIIQTKNGIIFKLEQDLEDEKRKNEESDLEMTTLISEKEKIIMALGEDKAELNNKVKRLEFKCSELNEKLRIANIELGDLKTEYTSYKVRAQAVLRQNQTVDHSQEEQLKEEAAALKAQIETLTVKLTAMSEQCAERTAEAESARRRVSESSAEASRAMQRTARLQADLTKLGQQLEEERTQHKLQISTLTQCYKAQISELEARLQTETESLRKKLAAAQENISAKRDDNSNQYLVPVIPKEESDGEMDINVSMIPREEGEGSEAAPSPPPSKSYMTSAGSGRSPVPLERLLEEGVPEDEALDTSSLGLTPDQEIADLKRRLQAQQQRVKHVTVLLSESEREGARLSQLSELLKSELRRVRAATHNAHNTEYMKNVTLKFLTLGPGDERSRLVPVLQKILTLTPEETLKIQAIAKGQDPNPGKGWGSYLPWPGGK